MVSGAVGNSDHHVNAFNSSSGRRCGKLADVYGTVGCIFDAAFRFPKEMRVVVRAGIEIGSVRTDTDFPKEADIREEMECVVYRCRRYRLTGRLGGLVEHVGSYMPIAAVSDQ